MSTPANGNNTAFKQCKLTVEELRWGNIVSYKGKPVLVDIQVLREIRGNNTDYEPVELTGELLKRQGFKTWVGFLGSIFFDLSARETTLQFKVSDKGIVFGYHGEDGFVPESVPLRYLHQIQNIYHSLTGEELKINTSAL